MQATDGTDGSWAAKGGDGDEMFPTLLLEGMADWHNVGRKKRRSGGNYASQNDSCGSFVSFVLPLCEARNYYQ